MANAVRSAVFLASVVLGLIIGVSFLLLVLNGCTASQAQEAKTAARVADQALRGVCEAVAVANADKLRVPAGKPVTSLCDAERLTRRLRELILAAQLDEAQQQEDAAAAATEPDDRALPAE